MANSFSAIDPAKAVGVLKFKYRDVLRKGPRGQKAKSRTGTTHPKRQRMIVGNGPRRHAYGPWFSHV